MLTGLIFCESSFASVGSTEPEPVAAPIDGISLIFGAGAAVITARKIRDKR